MSAVAASNKGAGTEKGDTGAAGAKGGDSSTALALAYLQEMIPAARNEVIKKRLVTRAQAFEAVLQIEQAIAAYKQRFQTDPEDLRRLVSAGLLERIPDDPYGGKFYLDEQGRVRTTSKFAPLEKIHGSHKN